MVGRRDFGLRTQQQLVCVILLRRLASLISTAVSIEGLHKRKPQVNGRRKKENAMHGQMIINPVFYDADTKILKRMNGVV